MQKYHCKLVLLGAVSVGKTSLSLRFNKGLFDEHVKETVGAAFSTKLVKTDNAEISFEIWDTAGHEKYQSIAPFYYRDALAAIIVYDITDVASLDAAGEWASRLRSENPSNMVIHLVGNKLDLDADRKVSAERGRAVANEHRMHFIEASARTGENVSAIFSTIAGAVPDLYADVSEDSVPPLDFDADEGGGCC
eukprot:gnl/Chilomastix_cuspidata/1466.p1 GENE.gnl/Chilomastix_cuspidata/1466~~gnl/Chilomastix_cuspidata/1466.p1  ORF type:complete len:206 (+),score=34.14 gnl/Chilomastix_cuspidata/1466:42-620(+)